MTFEMLGAGCFGVVIGFVAWHVFRFGESSFGVVKLTAFIAALASGVVLAVFPAGTTLFSAYSCALALGFFLVPASRLVLSGLASVSKTTHLSQQDTVKEVPDQLSYIEEKWSEVERVVMHALLRHRGGIREDHIQALPLDATGRVSALRKYARIHPDTTSFGAGWAGWTLRSLEHDQH